jgi:ABC-2 type transport system permease protein
VLQETVEPEMQGRVFGFVGIVMAVAMPLGMAVFGPLADVVSVELLLVLAGVALFVVVGVALAIGFRSGASVQAWLAVIGILILFTLALTWIAVIPGLSAKSADGASAFSYPLIFLPFVSSAFVPTDTMPGPVRAFADHQPVTSMANTVRDLFTQQSVGSDIWIALAWLVGLTIVAYSLAIAIYRRRIL